MSDPLAERITLHPREIEYAARVLDAMVTSGILPEMSVGSYVVVSMDLHAFARELAQQYSDEGLTELRAN